MKSDDLIRAPKLLCENVLTVISPEYFIMGMSSGNQATIYSFTPAHMKKLAQKLMHDIEQYEQKHGTINAKWNPNVVSPVQRGNPPLDQS